MRVVHHDLDDDGHELPHDRVCIAQLVAIDVAVPGGPAVDELVAQCVEPAEDHGQHIAGTVLCQGMPGRTVGGTESRLPVVSAVEAVEMVPVGLEDEFLIEQHADGTGVLFPDHACQAFPLVQLSKPLEEEAEQPGLRQTVLTHLVGVGRVEGDPQEDEAPVLVIATLGPVEPGQRTVDAKRKEVGPVVSLCPLSHLQLFVRSRHFARLP